MVHLDRNFSLIPLHIQLTPINRGTAPVVAATKQR
jgi:hypothetical protein